MEMDQEVKRNSVVWFFGMGLAAIALCVFMATIDSRLSNSTAEAELGAKLHELRVAQSSLNSRSTDTRQTGSR